MANSSDVLPGTEKGKKATSSSPLNNIHQLQFLVAVVCVATLIYVARVMLGPSHSIPPPETESLAPALQLSVSGEDLATQVSFLYGLVQAVLTLSCR